MILALNPPQSDELEEKNDQRNLLHRTLLIERQLNIGCRYQERLEDMLQHIFIREHILDGRLGMVEFARSHHFIALVIFRVLLTEAMRLLISFKDGMIDLLPVSF